MQDKVDMQADLKKIMSLSDAAGKIQVHAFG